MIPLVRVKRVVEEEEDNFLIIYHVYTLLQDWHITPFVFFIGRCSVGNLFLSQWNLIYLRRICFYEFDWLEACRFQQGFWFLERAKCRTKRDLANMGDGGGCWSNGVRVLARNRFTDKALWVLSSLSRSMNPSPITQAVFFRLVLWAYSWIVSSNNVDFVSLSLGYIFGHYNTLNINKKKIRSTSLSKHHTHTSVWFFHLHVLSSRFRSPRERLWVKSFLMLNVTPRHLDFFNFPIVKLFLR